MSKIKKRIFEQIDERKEDIIKYLQKLIQIPTQAVPGQNYDIIANFIKKKLGKIGCEVSHHYRFHFS